MLPFNSLPRVMVMHSMKMLVLHVIAFTCRRGVSQIILLLTIAEGVALGFNLHFRAIFEYFLQTFGGTDNTMTPRTIDAIAIGPTGNLQGGIMCFSLATAKPLNHQ